MMSINAKTKPKLVRLAAACLLFFAFVDIFCPPPSCCCGVEGFEGAAVSLSSNDAQGSTQTAAFDNSDGVPRDQHSDCPTCDEDCFCCGHAMANTAFAATSAPDQKPILTSPAVHPVPNPPLRGTYHPPRFA
jgi:hypothetical protein